jgi:hypothetical protein
MDVNAQKSTFKGYGLVRNSEGQPQFDDYSDIPEVFYPLLTQEDWEYIETKREEQWQ